MSAMSIFSGIYKQPSIEVGVRDNHPNIAVSEASSSFSIDAPGRRSSRPWVNISEEDEDTITQELNEALRQVNELSNAVQVQGSNVTVDAAGLIDQKRILEGELTEARSEIASLRNQVHDQAQARDYHSSQTVESRDSLDDATHQRHEDNELRSVKRNLTDSETKISSLNNNNDMLAAKVEMLTTKIEGLDSDKREAEFKNVELMEKNKEYEQLLDQTMADLQTVSDVNEDLASTLEEVSMEKEEAMAKVRELAADLANNNRSSGKYFEQAERLTVENNDLTLQLKEAISENRGKVEQLSQLRNQIADYRSKSKECDSELRTLRAEVETRTQAEGGKPLIHGLRLFNMNFFISCENKNMLNPMYISS